MGLRLIRTETNGTSTVKTKVYRDSECDEYRVKLFIAGVHRTRADYHTDDKGDALATAKVMARDCKA